jgi:hypothetical protein
VQFGEAIFCIVALPHCVWVSAGGELYRVNLRVTTPAQPFWNVGMLTSASFFTQIQQKLEVETGWTAHERPITDLLYLPEENVVFSCAGDGIIRVWKDHYTGLENYSSLQSEASLRPASLLRELTSSINVSALCPASPRSGLRICAGHIDGAISLWDSDVRATFFVLSPTRASLSFFFIIVIMARTDHIVATVQGGESGQLRRERIRGHSLPAQHPTGGRRQGLVAQAGRDPVERHPRRLHLRVGLDRPRRHANSPVVGPRPVRDGAQARGHAVYNFEHPTTTNTQHPTPNTQHPTNLNTCYYYYLDTNNTKEKYNVAFS